MNLNIKVWKTGIAAILMLGMYSSTYAQNLTPVLANGTIAINYAAKIYYDSDELRNKILVTFEPLESDKNKNYIVVEIDEQEHRKLLDVGLKVVVDTHLTEAMNAPTPTLSSKSNTTRFSSPITGALAGNTYPAISGYSCYRTVEGTFSTAEDIVTAYPNLANWSDVGNSWEKQNGLGGFDMKVLKITNSANTQTKPALFITSSIHAREYAPAELTTRFAEHLVTQYGLDADITWMLDHHEVHFMLHANPDGRKQAETGLSWRKNTNQNYCGVSSNTRGADLNRNFEYQWNCCNGSSTNECSLTYHGAGPASEPETKSIQNYMESLFGDNRGSGLADSAPLDTTGVYLDIHSYSELILWPWGFTNSPAPNNMVSLGRKLALTNGYTPQQSIGLYPTDGTTTSFAYGDLGIASYTFELGTAFFQDCNTFENTIVPDNFPSLIYALKAARAPYQLPLGPDVINLDLDLGDTSPIPAGTAVTLTATASDTRYNNSNGTEPSQNISTAEYFINTPPWQTGAIGISISASDGTYNNSNEAISTGIDTTSLSEGKHTIFVRSKDANNNWGAPSAIFLNIDNNAVLPTVVFEDDFETNLGWTSNPSNTDTATTGQWHRADPQDTNSSGPKQLGTTVSGSFDLVTGATAGSSVGVNDIDNGVTSIRSPDIALPSGGPYTLSFSYYMAHTSNSSSEDFFRVTVVGNQNSLVLEELGANNDDDGAWVQFSTNIDAYAGQSIYLLIEAADAGNGSIVEAGVDDLKIEGIIATSNQPPSIVNPGNQTSDEGDSISLALSASDPEGNTLSYSASGLPAELNIDTTTGLITGTLGAQSAGNYDVTITVSDGTSAVNESFIWSINNVNLPSIISNPGDQTNNEQDSVNLQMTATNPDSDILSFSANALPDGLSIDSDTGLISGSLSTTSSGNYTISVSVNDGIVSDTTSFNWLVNNVNQFPSVSSPGNQNSFEGDAVTLAINAIDPDGDSLTYSATGLPPGLTINVNTGLISGTITTATAGNYSITVTASDGFLSDSTSFDWLISPILNNTAWLQTILVNGVDSSNWTTVNLNHSYNSLVAICTVNYQNNSIPVIVRMKDVGSNSFDIRLQNPSESPLSAEAIHCIAMEEGSWTLDDGRKIEAQIFNSTITDSRTSWLGQNASYLASYTTPVVVGQVMSYNDPDWSIFWSRGSSRQSPATSSDLFVGKQVSEDTDITRNDETLGFIVTEAGIGTANNVAYEIQLGADTIDTRKIKASYNYLQSFSGTPEIAIATQTAMDGNNGSWAVLREANPLANGKITLVLDEDQIGDSERNHTTEQVMYMVFESASEMELTPSP